MIVLLIILAVVVVLVLFLIAQYNGVSQAIEVDREGNVVWKCAVRGSCSTVHRLDNGNTLIASAGASVLEVTPACSVVWEYPVSDCYGCQPLRSHIHCAVSASSSSKRSARQEEG